jgi:hypothetical protein
VLLAAVTWRGAVRIPGSAGRQVLAGGRLAWLRAFIAHVSAKRDLALAIPADQDLAGEAGPPLTRR